MDLCPPRSRSIPNRFWNRLQSKFGSIFYIRENGEDQAIIAAVDTIDQCLRMGYCVVRAWDDRLMILFLNIMANALLACLLTTSFFAIQDVPKTMESSEGIFDLFH